MLIVAPAAVPDPPAAIRARLAGFAGFLRANGYGVGGGDGARVLEAAERVGILEAQPLRWSLKALLCGRAGEWRRFDALFDAYFLPPNKRAFAEGETPATRRDAGVPQPSTEAQEGEERGAAAGADTDGDARHGASREESVASMDFRTLARADHLRDIEAAMRRFARRVKWLRLRREAASARGWRLDLRGTIRRSVATGGAPVRLAWRVNRRVRPRLVWLLDVSRSMSAYSFFHLRLARALLAELADVHCYIFHTRITEVGSALRDADPRRSQERLELLAAGWGGGTRIGECLATFNRDHAPRLVHARTGVIIVSDGYDTGDPQALAAALAALGRRARRVVWLNPLLGQPGYAPESRGMRAALPHLDLLAPGGDLAAIERALPAVIEALR
jgi:uncharacterized protein with von Willebrand factor type A (vWA) domain